LLAWFGLGNDAIELLEHVGRELGRHKVLQLLELALAPIRVVVLAELLMRCQCCTTERE